MNRRRADQDGFAGIGEIRKLTGLGSAKVLRHALLGEIAVDLRPGRAPRYRLADVLAIAASK